MVLVIILVWYYRIGWRISHNSDLFFVSLINNVLDDNEQAKKGRVCDFSICFELELVGTNFKIKRNDHQHFPYLSNIWIRNKSMFFWVESKFNSKWRDGNREWFSVHSNGGSLCACYGVLPNVPIVDCFVASYSALVCRILPNAYQSGKCWSTVCGQHLHVHHCTFDGF